MLNKNDVKSIIEQYRMMNIGTRKYADIVILLFGTLEENQYASVNFFKDTIISFGYELDRADAKVLQSRINQMVGNSLERLALFDLADEKRIPACVGAAGTIRHDGQHRTRALFRLNPKGKEILRKTLIKFPLNTSPQEALLCI